MKKNQNYNHLKQKIEENRNTYKRDRKRKNGQ